MSSSIEVSLVDASGSGFTTAISSAPKRLA